MSSRLSKCKQGWVPQFSSSAHALWRSLTQMCAKCFTPSLFVAKTRKPKGAQRWHFLKGSWNCNHFPSLPSLGASAALGGFLIPVTFAAKSIFTLGFKTCSNFSSSWGKTQTPACLSSVREHAVPDMKHQILYSLLQLISVIRKENPPGIWNRNCLRIRAAFHEGTGVLDTIPEIPKCFFGHLLGWGEPIESSFFSFLYKQQNSNLLRTYQKTPTIAESMFCPSEPDPCPDALVKNANRLF